MRLNGRQTIYQMVQLADEVRRRGGIPLEPLAYKNRYHDLLMGASAAGSTRWSRGRPVRTNGPYPAATPSWTRCGGAA